MYRDTNNLTDTPTPLREARAARVPGRPYQSSGEWRSVALISTGVAIGVLLGAGVALLFAPKTGAQIRDLIATRIRRRRDRDVWADLREELDQVGVRLATARARVQGPKEG